MNLNFFKGLLFSFLWLFLWSCGTKQGNMSNNHIQIPNDVHFVASFDVKSLQSKSKDILKVIDKDALTNLNISEKEAKEIEKIGRNILTEGVDLTQKIYAFAKIGNNPKDSHMGITFVIKDGKNLEKSIKLIASQNNKRVSSYKEGDINAIELNQESETDKILLGWKNKTGLLLITGNKKNANPTLRELFAAKSTESIFVKNKQVAEMEGKNKDIAFWVDYVKANEISQKINPEAEAVYNKPAMKSLIEAAQAFTLYANFENGEVKIDSDFFLDPKKSKTYEAMIKNGFNQNFVKNIPLASPHIVSGFSLALKPLFELLKQDKQIKENEENIQKELGISSDELVNMLSGDFLLAMKNLSIESAAVGNFESSEVIIALGINQKEIFEKMLKKGNIFKDVKKENNFYVYRSPEIPFIAPSFTVFIIPNNEGIYITTNKNLKNSLIKGEKRASSEFLAMTKSNSGIMFLDFEFFNQFKMLLNGNPFMKVVVPEMKNITFETGSVTNHKISSKGSIKLTNTKENSLAVLLNISRNLQKEYAEEMKKYKKQMEEMQKKMDDSEKIDNLKEEKPSEPEESL